jgi:hypothetical protein
MDDPEEHLNSTSVVLEAATVGGILSTPAISSTTQTLKSNEYRDGLLAFHKIDPVECEYEIKKDNLYHSELSPIPKLDEETGTIFLFNHTPDNMAPYRGLSETNASCSKSPPHNSMNNIILVDGENFIDTKGTIPISERGQLVDLATHIRSEYQSSSCQQLLSPIEIQLTSVENLRTHHNAEGVNETPVGLPSIQALNQIKRMHDSPKSTSVISTANLVIVGSASLAFHQKIKGAAFKRKKSFSISRDSLAAKERHHREVVAASIAARKKLLEKPIELLSKNIAADNPASTFTFLARPVPAPSRIGGTGGLQGIPKVEKRQPTVPSSPMLGLKRSTRNYPNEITSEISTKKIIFRRLHGGISGIPKVDKRPTTVPSSPLLGKRRKNNSFVTSKHAKNVVCEQSYCAKDVENKVNCINLRNRKMNDFSKSASIKKMQTNNTLACLPVSDTTESRESLVPGDKAGGHFLHSTLRAKKRADFNRRKCENEILKMQQKKTWRRTKIKEKEGELDLLKLTI